MIRRWDIESGNAIGEPLAGHTGNVEVVAASKDWIVSAAQTHRANLGWADGREVRSVTTRTKSGMSR